MIKNRKVAGVIFLLTGFLLLLVSSYLKFYKPNVYFPPDIVQGILIGWGLAYLLTDFKKVR